MQILFAGNIANVGYTTAVQMHKMDISADLIIAKNPSKNSDPVFLVPELNNAYPDWIKFYHQDKLFWKFELAKKIRDKKYDLIQAQYGFVSYALASNRPYITQVVGSDLHVAAFSNSLRGLFFRTAYKKSKLVFFTSPNDLKLILKLKLKDCLFMPIMWDMSFFKPISEEENKIKDKLIIFHPSNLNWKVKGNNLLIQGFARFIKNYPNAFLIIIDWGVDSLKTKELVHSLKIEKNVQFVNGPINHEELKMYYNMCDVVVDQFVLSGVGGIACEALGCAKPVIVNCQEGIYENLYDESPPIVHAQTESEICKKLELLTDEKLRNDFGKKGREWVLKHHSPEIVGTKMKKIYEMIIEGKKRKEICEEFNLSSSGS